MHGVEHGVETGVLHCDEHGVEHDSERDVENGFRRHVFFVILMILTENLDVAYFDKLINVVVVVVGIFEIGVALRLLRGLGLLR